MFSVYNTDSPRFDQISGSIIVFISYWPDHCKILTRGRNNLCSSLKRHDLISDLWSWSPLRALKYIGVHMLRKLEWFWDFEKPYIVFTKPATHRNQWKCKQCHSLAKPAISFLDCLALGYLPVPTASDVHFLFLIQSGPSNQMSREKNGLIDDYFFVAGCICKS